jgi:hypothetical protein
MAKCDIRAELDHDEIPATANNHDKWRMAASDRQAGGHWFEPSTAHSLDVEVTTKSPANGDFVLFRSLRARLW